MNRHWESFLEDVAWAVKRGQSVDIGESKQPGSWNPGTANFSQLFPALERLLKRAFVTEVTISGTRYQLYSWNCCRGGECAWLSPLPSRETLTSLYAEHRELLSSFGGITQRANESERTWLLNHNDVLTEKEAEKNAEFLEHYKWFFEQAGASIPIVLQEYYSIAQEANGNTTFCHRVTGEVVLFAPDHDFNHIVPYPGCPDGSLYRIHGAHSFRDWVNTVAGQWLEEITE